MIDQNQLNHSQPFQRIQNLSLKNNQRLDDIVSDDEIKSKQPSQQQFLNISKTVGIEKSETPKIHQKNHNEDKLYYPMDLLYIVYYSFKHQLENICQNHNCSMKLINNYLKVFQKYAQNSDTIFKKCINKISLFLKSINFTSFTCSQIYRAYQSPYFLKKCQDYQINLLKFNNQIYAYSTILSENQLRTKTRQLIMKQYLFRVKILSAKQLKQSISQHLIKFVKNWVKYNLPETQSRSVLVQVSKSHQYINCIGYQQKQVYACKIIIKNLLESITIILFKKSNQDQVIDKQQVSAYIKKISKFPIYCDKMYKKTYVVITKDNIMRSLIGKPKFAQIMKITPSTTIIMYILRVQSYPYKIKILSNLCHELGYQLTRYASIYLYPRKIFINHRQQTDINQHLEIIQRCLQQLQDTKKVLQVPSNFRKSKKSITALQGLQSMQNDYILTGQTVDDDFLSDLLRRNVMLEKIKMSKNKIIEYKICQQKQQYPIYWTMQKRAENRLIVDNIKQHKKQDIMQIYKQNGKQLCELYKGYKKAEQGLYIIEGKVLIENITLISILLKNRNNDKIQKYLILNKCTKSIHKIYFEVKQSFYAVIMIYKIQFILQIQII